MHFKCPLFSHDDFHFADGDRPLERAAAGSFCRRAWAFGIMQAAKRREPTVDPLVAGAMSDEWSILYSHGSGMGPRPLQQIEYRRCRSLIGVNNYRSIVPQIVAVLLLSEGGGHGRSDNSGNPNLIAKRSLGTGT